MNPTPRPARVAPSNRAAALPRRSSLPAVASAMKPRIDGTLAAVEAPSSSARAAEHGEVRGQPGHDHRDRRRRPARRASPGDGRAGRRGSRRTATGRARRRRTSQRAAPTDAGVDGRARRARGASRGTARSIAPVRPVLKRSVKVPASTARRERSIAGSVAARRARSDSRHRAGPRPYHARNVPAVPRRRNALEPRRDLHRFRVGHGPGGCRERGDRASSRCWSLRPRNVQGRRRALGRGLLGADGGRRMRRSPRRPPRRRATSRTPTRPPSRPAPRRSSRSTWPARCRARSRAPRSRATCCPTARSTSSTRSAPRWREGILARMARRARRRGPAGRRDRRGARGARAGHADVRRARDPRVPQEGRPDQRARRPRSGPCSRSSRSSRWKHGVVETADRVRTRAKARERRHRADLANGPSSAWRSCTPSPRTSRRFRDEVRGPGRPPESRSRGASSIHLGRRVGRARTSAQAASAPRCCTGPEPRACTGVVAWVAARLRQPCRPVPSGRRRSEVVGLYSAAA